MKNRLFAFAISIVMVAFAINTSILAQNKEVKNPGKTIKQTEQKVDSKINKARTPTEAKITMNTVKSKETMKTEMKKDMGKMDMKKKEMNEKIKKNEREIKHHTMPMKKSEVKKTTTEKKY